MKTYVFEVDIEQDEDGIWEAVVPALPGCNAWGYTKKETLEAIRENAEMYLEVLIEDGDPMPWEKETVLDNAGAETLTITV